MSYQTAAIQTALEHLKLAHCFIITANMPEDLAVKVQECITKLLQSVPVGTVREYRQIRGTMQQ